jgi:hypothetical protein
VSIKEIAILIGVLAVGYWLGQSGALAAIMPGNGN